MRTLKLTLAYDGTAFAGWQSQPGQRTVQGALEEALARITGESIRVLASGRTDAGVHALGQVVRVRTVCRLDAPTLARALGATLPGDVAVVDLAEAPDDFHPIRDARSKRYRYVLADGPVRDVFRRAYCWQCRRRLDDRAMHAAAQSLLGRHDFRSFQSSGAPRASTVRTVFDVQVQRAGAGERASRIPERGRAGGENLAETERGRAGRENLAEAERGRAGEGDLVQVEVEADGFLYNMVRAIVGTLVEVGRGARPPEWVGEVLQAADRGAAGPTAPPQGLFLVRVTYQG